MLYWTLVVISIFFQVKLLQYFILFCLIDFCTIIIGEINMANNVDEQLYPQYGAMKNWSAYKPGVMQLL